MCVNINFSVELIRINCSKLILCCHTVLSLVEKDPLFFFFFLQIFSSNIQCL